MEHKFINIYSLIFLFAIVYYSFVFRHWPRNQGGECMYVHVFLKAGLKYLYFSLPDDMISATLAERQMTMTVTILIAIMTMVVTMVVMMLMTIMMLTTMVVMMLMLMMMVMTVHNFTPWWMLTPAAINFTPDAGKTADVSLSPALPSSSSNRLHHNHTTLYRTTGGFIALVLSTNRLNPHSYQHQCDWIRQAGPTGGFHSPGRSIKSKIRIANHLTASHLIIIKNTLLSLLWSKPVLCLQDIFGEKEF